MAKKMKPIPPFLLACFCICWGLVVFDVYMGFHPAVVMIAVLCCLGPTVELRRRLLASKNEMQKLRA